MGGALPAGEVGAGLTDGGTEGGGGLLALGAGGEDFDPALGGGGRRFWGGDCPGLAGSFLSGLGGGPPPWGSAGTACSADICFLSWGGEGLVVGGVGGFGRAFASSELGFLG